MMIKTVIFIFLLVSAGFVIPEPHQVPVLGATAKDWNPRSFWYYPWGRSGVHKGIDIFASENTPVVAPTNGIILFSGQVPVGGNVIYMLGPKWRFHYFAHLNKIDKKGGFVQAGQKIGLVGSSGNAQRKPPHLHYSIKSIFPRLTHYDSHAVYAWQRVFYLNPEKFIKGSL